MLTESEIDYYSQGQCLALAVVMAEKLDRPVYVLYRRGMPVHCYVDYGQGLGADIEGLHAIHALEREWEADSSVPFRGMIQGTLREKAEYFARTRNGEVPDWDSAELASERVETYWRQIAQALG